MRRVSPRTQWLLQVQGYASCTLEEMGDYRFGIRFTYLTCGSIAAVGLALVNSPLIIALAVIAFLGVLLPNHPFDYIYNYGVRHAVKRPAIPRRSPQIKFACGVATAWLLVTVILFNGGYILAGQIWGAFLVASATLVGLTDICIPSMTYNLITRKKVNPFEEASSTPPTSVG